jgi:Mor family transcriptional regulator
MAARRAELLEDVHAHVLDLLRDLGIDQDTADQCGSAVADRLCEHWGGQVISFPQDSAYKMSLREQQIVAELKAGMGKSELAMKYRITMRGLNMLLRRATQRHQLDAQPDLFGPPATEPAGAAEATATATDAGAKARSAGVTAL